jgi:hypothetical protein
MSSGDVLTLLRLPDETVPGMAKPTNSQLQELQSRL